MTFIKVSNFSVDPGEEFYLNSKTFEFVLDCKCVNILFCEVLLVFALIL